MRRRADILISAPHGRPLAAVEVKNLPRLSLGDASELRDGLVEYLARPIEYVLVVSQTRAFIWKRRGDDSQYGEPEALDMRPILREYLTDAELDRHIRGVELELVLSHWLGDLARGRVTSPGGVAQQGPFVQFLSDIRGAEINLEAAA